MKNRTRLKGKLFLGFLSTGNQKEVVNEINDLISNYEELSLEDLRANYADVQFYLDKKQIDPQREIHEILISQLLWVDFGDIDDKATINEKIISIKAWFELARSKPLNADQIAFLQSEKEFDGLIFSVEEPLNSSTFRELELI